MMEDIVMSDEFTDKRRTYEHQVSNQLGILSVN